MMKDSGLGFRNSWPPHSPLSTKTMDEFIAKERFAECNAYGDSCLYLPVPSDKRTLALSSCRNTNLDS